MNNVNYKGWILRFPW